MIKRACFDGSRSLASQSQKSVCLRGSCIYTFYHKIPHQNTARMGYITHFPPAGRHSWSRWPELATNKFPDGNFSLPLQGLYTFSAFYFVRLVKILKRSCEAMPIASHHLAVFALPRKANKNIAAAFNSGPHAKQFAYSSSPLTPFVEYIYDKARTSFEQNT